MSRINPNKLKPTALADYVSWLQTESKQHTVGVGNGKARGTDILLYVIPFNVSVPANFYVRTGCTQAAYTALNSKLTGYMLNSLTSPNVSETLEQFKAARVVQRSGRSARGTAKVSHITARQYNSYGGTSNSMPFGKTAAANEETEIGNFEAIRAKFLVNSTLPAGTELSLVKEKFTERTA